MKCLPVLAVVLCAAACSNGTATQPSPVSGTGVGASLAATNSGKDPKLACTEGTATTKAGVLYQCTGGVWTVFKDGKWQPAPSREDVVHAGRYRDQGCGDVHL